MAKRSAILALVAAFFYGPAAQAATTVVNGVLNGPFVFVPSNRQRTFFTQLLTPPIPFSSGDTLDVTLTFPGGTPLNLGFLPSNAIFTAGGTVGNTGTLYQSTGTFAFINPIGAVNPITGPQTGVFFRNPAIDFTSLRQVQRGPLSFDGIHVVMHIDSATLGGLPVPPDVVSVFSVTFINDVPEPATWSMMILGFGLIGVLMRRRAGSTPEPSAA